MITKQGREIATQLAKAGAEWGGEQHGDIVNTVSLICRHSKTYRRFQEIQCGDDVHDGDWVNKNWQWIQKRDDQIESRLLVLAESLPANIRLQLDGDPRGLVVRLIVTDNLGVPRTVGVE
jgi:hypothetical protein